LLGLVVWVFLLYILFVSTVVTYLGPRSVPVVTDYAEAPVVTNCQTAVDTSTPSCRLILNKPGMDRLQFPDYSYDTMKIVTTVL